MPGTVRLVKEGSLAWLIFDHAERRNAITREMWQEIPPLARTAGAVGASIQWDGVYLRKSADSR